MARQTDPTTRRGALALLGLPETATGPEVVHAYRRLVRATHPDATGRTDPGAAREFSAIHHAYQLLAHGDDPARDPTDEPVEASLPRKPGDASGACPQAWPTQANRLPPEEVPAFRPRPPIVAGPVVVTALPEQHQRHRRRPQ
jgi:DnaJ domain